MLTTATTTAAAEDSVITTVVGLVGESEAAQGILAGEGPMTVFLPVDTAFEMLDADLLEMVATNPALRDEVLTYHVVQQGLPAAAVVDAITAGEVEIATVGGPISLGTDEDGNVVVGGATVIATDIFASNGVVHLIDSVILPPAE